MQTCPFLPTQASELNSIVGLIVCYDTFQIKNSDWLWLISDIVATINRDNILCGSFGLYASYAAGILNWVEKIHLYLVCSEQLNYENYIKKYTAGQECCISYKVHTGCYFKLSSGGKIIASFETSIIHGLLPSSLIFAQNVLNKINFSSLAYGIVSITKRVTYITNEVLTLKHDCVFEVYTCNLNLPKQPAGCMLYTQRCSAYPQKNYPFYILYCTVKSHPLV